VRIETVARSAATASLLDANGDRVEPEEEKLESSSSGRRRGRRGGRRRNRAKAANDG
jgi:hypothetical protein